MILWKCTVKEVSFELLRHTDRILPTDAKIGTTLHCFSIIDFEVKDLVDLELTIVHRSGGEYYNKYFSKFELLIRAYENHYPLDGIYFSISCIILLLYLHECIRK